MTGAKRQRVEDEAMDAVVAKATKSQIQKVVKRTLFRNCEVKTVQLLSTGTVQDDSATPFGNTIACPIPVQGTASNQRVGDKIRVIKWEINVTFVLSGTGDRLRISMCCRKANGQQAVIAYNDAYGVTSGSPAVAMLQGDNMDEITEYNDHQIQLSSAGDNRAAYRRAHKFKYPLTMSFGGTAGTAADVIRNLLFVAFAGDNTPGGTTYQIQQRVEYIDA